MKGEQPETSTAAELFRASSVVYLVFATVGLGWIRWREGAIDRALFFDPSGFWIDIGLGLGAGVLLVGSWELARRGFDAPRRLEDRLREMLGGLDRTQVFVLAVISSIAEEIFFRGALQAVTGWIAATLIFAVLHSGRGRDYLLWPVTALVAGAVLGLEMEARGNLLAPIVTHFTVNLVGIQLLIDRGRSEGNPRRAL